MSDGVRDGVNESPIGHAPGHARHDRLLVTRYAAADTTDREADDARALIGSCPDCARLAADISQLRTSLAALPIPVRTRNFRLSREQAEQLRGSAFERFLRRLAMPQLALVRPIAGIALAAGLTITAVGAVLPSALTPAAGIGDRGPVFGAAGAPTGTGQPAGQAPGNQAQPTTGEASVPSPTAGGAAGTALPQPVLAVSTAPSPAPQASDTHAGIRPSPAGSSPAPKATAGATAAPIAPLPAVSIAPPTPLPTVSGTFTAVLPPTAAGGPTAGSPGPPSTNTGEPATDLLRLFLIYGGVTLAMVAFAVLLLSVYARRHSEDPLLR